jgi:hypothetical protein
MKKQLNVWIESDLKLALTELAQSQGKSLKELVEGILSHSVAAQRGQIVERHFLPELRKVIRTETRDAHTEQLVELCEYMQVHVVNEIKAMLRRNSL